MRYITLGRESGTPLESIRWHMYLLHMELMSWSCRGSDETCILSVCDLMVCSLDSSAWVKGSEPGVGNFNKRLWNHCWNAQCVLICGYSETLLNQMLFRESWPSLQLEHAALRPYLQAGSQRSRPWTSGGSTSRREEWRSQTTPATT